MNNDTPITNAAWSAAKEQTDTNGNPDWGCVAHDMRDKCEEIERKKARLASALRILIERHGDEVNGGPPITGEEWEIASYALPRIDSHP
jgi:hypothetical protein